MNRSKLIPCLALALAVPFAAGCQTQRAAEETKSEELERRLAELEGSAQPRHRPWTPGVGRPLAASAAAPRRRAAPGRAPGPAAAAEPSARPAPATEPAAASGPAPVALALPRVRS